MFHVKLLNLIREFRRAVQYKSEKHLYFKMIEI